MAASIQEIVATVFKVPNQFAEEFAQMLIKLSQAMLKMGYERFMKQQQALLSGQETSAKGFRKPPFLRGLDVDRDTKLVEEDLDSEQQTPRPS